MKSGILIVLLILLEGCNDVEETIVPDKLPLEAEEVKTVKKIKMIETKVHDIPSWFPSTNEISKNDITTKEDWEDLFSIEILHRSENSEQMMSRPHLIFDKDDNPLVLWEEENVFATKIDNSPIIVRYNNLAITRWNGKEWMQMNRRQKGAELITDFGREVYPEYWKKVADIQIESVKSQQMRNFASRIPDKKTVAVMDYRKLGSHWLNGRLILLWKGYGGIFVTQWDGSKWVKMDRKSLGTELAVTFQTENEAVMESIRFKFAFDRDQSPYLVWREPLEALRGGFYEAKDNVDEDGIFLIRYNGEVWTHADGETIGAELISKQKLIAYVLPSLFFDPDDRLVLSWVVGDALKQTNIPEQASRLLVTTWDGENWVKADGTVGRDEFKPSEGIIYYQDFGVNYSPEGHMIVEYYSYTDPLKKKKNSYLWGEDAKMWAKFEVVIDEEE